jgi:hypothetical protein
MDLGYFSSAYNGRRGKSGFSMVLTVVIGLILTVIALALMVTSQSEVQVASNQTRSVSALNAAEAGGTIALNQVVASGNSVQSVGFDANNLLSYMCASNSQFVAVKQVTAPDPFRQGATPISEVTYRLVDFAAGASTDQFLNKNGTPADVTTPPGTRAYNPLNLSFSSLDPLESRLASTNTAVISSSNFGGNLNIVGLPTTVTGCPIANTFPQVSGAGSTTSVTYFPGIAATVNTPATIGLTWTANTGRGIQEVVYSAADQSTNVRLAETRMATVDGNDICSAPQILNFKLSQVQVVNSLGNRPTGGFRLVYSFVIRSEGRLRTPSAAGSCQGTIIGRQIVQSPNILVLNVIPPGSFAKYGTFIDRFDTTKGFAGGSVYEGRTHINTAPSFDVRDVSPGVLEAPALFTGEFTTAGCGTIGSPSPAAGCGSVDIPNNKYGTISGIVNGVSSSTLSTLATFGGGLKDQERGQEYIPAPSYSAYQTKAALTGQMEPSPTIAQDILKASDIQATIGIKNAGTTAPTEPDGGAVVPGVYWVNPTGSSDPASSTAATKPADYNAWLAKASADLSTNPQNKTDNLLAGLYISGSVDYVNLYAATSPTAPVGAGPDQQVIEIRQTINGSAKKFKFTITPRSGTNPGTTQVEVASGTGSYGAPISYGKALNGVVVVDGSIGDSTVGCAAKDNCRGLISIPPDNSTTAPSIQKDTGIGIYATGNIAIQDNLTYQVDPRTDASAKNALGVAAFPTRSYKDASGTVISTTLYPDGSGGTTPVNPRNGTAPVNGSIFWGNGLRDNKITSTTGTTSITLQASFYAYTQGFNGSTGVTPADYLNILGGRVVTVQGANRTPTASTIVNLARDSRFEDGTISPPGYINQGSSTTYQIAPVGRQSIGNVRWQLLPDPNQ